MNQNLCHLLFILEASLMQHGVTSLIDQISYRHREAQEEELLQPFVVLGLYQLENLVLSLSHF